MREAISDFFWTFLALVSYTSLKKLHSLGHAFWKR